MNQNSVCPMIGNKLHQLISEESHHTEWEEFRKRAQSRNLTEECSNLLRKMELEEFDGEDNDVDIDETNQNEEKISLEELQNKVSDAEDGVKGARKVHKRK